MRALAVRLDEDPDVWGLAGLGHDLDAEETEARRRAPRRPGGGDRSARLGLPDEAAHAVAAHNPDTGVVATERIDVALIAADQLSGLITAAALVRPDKDLAGVKVKSVRKRYREGAFARGVDRESIARCEELGHRARRVLRPRARGHAGHRAPSSASEDAPRGAVRASSPRFLRRERGVHALPPRRGLPRGGSSGAGRDVPCPGADARARTQLHPRDAGQGGVRPRPLRAGGGAASAPSSPTCPTATTPTTRSPAACGRSGAGKRRGATCGWPAPCIPAARPTAGASTASSSPLRRAGAATRARTAAAAAAARRRRGRDAEWAARRLPERAPGAARLARRARRLSQRLRPDVRHLQQHRDALLDRRVRVEDAGRPPSSSSAGWRCRGAPWPGWRGAAAGGRRRWR